jgi:hypothetical protein
MRQGRDAMSTLETRQATAQLRRVQTLLVLLILWDVLALMAEFSFGGALMKIDDGAIGGYLGARASFSGATVLPIGLYLYALVRGATRHRFILWCAALEQGSAVVLGAYHVAMDNVALGAAVGPVAAAGVLLLLVLVNMPGSSPRTV